MATGQHRCVFVGNIPYDATEEQLVEICQEVGPVVSFRLVIDRETGKPKGYGFCEYKDEETALSARRNLQGYEINGRQLRVDFAENDKTSDRSQGRGGPGLAPSNDPSKQVGHPAIIGDSTHHHSIGLQIAITAATVMVGALGGAQGGVQSQLALANDPLTLHLAKLSRNQLNEILSDMKVMATQNKESARQLLLGRPQLSKALFQAQIMLGMVTPQVLQTPNLVQGHASQTPSQVGRIAPPLETQLPSLPKVKEGQVSTMPQNALTRSQISAPSQLPMQHRAQLPLHANDHALQQAALRGNSLVSPFPPIQPHSSSSLSVRPHIPMASSSSNQQIPPSSLHSLAYNSQMVHSNATVQPSLIPNPSPLDTQYQPGPSVASGILQPTSRDTNRPAQVGSGTAWANRNLTDSSLPLELAQTKRVISGSTESVYRPSKKTKRDVRTLPLLNIYNPNGSTQEQVSGVAETPIAQAQLPSGVESALLQQVLNLTPEQLSLLPPEQKQEVIQLQQMLRRDQVQPS